MIEHLQKKMKTLALLDAIIEQEWEYRYFSYNSNWSDTEEMASLRDGCGGEWFLWISGKLAAYKCLSPEDGLMSDLEEAKTSVPDKFTSFITEPAFSMDQATCIWYSNNSKWIKYGNPVNSLFDIEVISNWSANDYQTWASNYYEQKVDLEAVEQIFNGQFDETIVMRLNPVINMSDLISELPEIGITQPQYQHHNVEPKPL